MNYATKYWNSVEILHKLSQQNTPLHHVPALAKLACAVVYLLAVISVNTQQLAYYLYLGAGIIFLAIVGKVPFSFLKTKIIMVLPFVLLFGISNLLLQRAPAQGMPLGITIGMLQFCGIFLKTVETVALVTILVATTKEEELLAAGRKIHIPSIILLQLQLILRYLGILVEEAERMSKAYTLKKPQEKAIAFKDFGYFLGLLLLRTLDRAERVYRAMKCRGYYREQGENHD